MLEIRLTADELVCRLLTLPPSFKLALLDGCSAKPGAYNRLIAGINPSESFEFYCRNQAEAFGALEFLNKKLEQYRASGGDMFTNGGACIATFSYEFGMLFEDLHPRRKEFRVFEQPSATLNFYETLAVHDYQTGKSFLVGKQAEEMRRLLEKTKAESSFFIPKNIRLQSNFSRTDYLSAIEQIRERIASGDIYQANLTQQIRLESTENFTPAAVFRHLRKFHPARFAAFLQRKNDTVVSASPERFLQIQNSKLEVQNSRIVTAQPIKGTKKRGASPDEDDLLRRELEKSVKDRAENVMIVDLLRNDLGRVCEFGSVRVENLCSIEEHPTLFHLVSTVRGKLRENVKPSDLLKAAFPCGSITGAPKIRAMQILDEIETAPRDLSMGAIGYFGFDGSMDLNVAIRTAVVRANRAVFNVGGGIVYDSQPAAEYEESLVKARALLNAFNLETSDGKQVTGER